MAPVPAPRREFLAVTNDVGIYVFGGAESTILDLTDTVFKYSIAGNSWTTLAPTLGAPTRTSGVKVANNRAWVFPFDVSPKQMQIFDLDTETFIGESAILPNGKKNIF